MHHDALLWFEFNLSYELILFYFWINQETAIVIRPAILPLR